MNQQDMVALISEQVLKEVEFWAALIGFSGVVIGALLTFIGNVIFFKIQERKKDKNDIARKKLLKQMLDNPKFKEGRSFETLSRVTGTTAEDCHRLLIELEARGFTMADGRIGWTYIKNRPLDEL